MKILILGDVMGMPGRKAVKKNLSKIIKELEIDFSVINGENAADDGRGITKEIAEELFSKELMLLLQETISGIKKRLQSTSKKKAGF